jgi:hypothetical protein
MTTTIEVTASAIRLCVTAEQRITGLESWPVPLGADPLAVLAAAPLPDGLGKVRVLLHHDDLLTRTLVQPGCAPDRLDKLVRFELGNLAGPGADDAVPSAISWHLVPIAGADGEMRVLAQIARLRLIEQVRQALAPRGAKLAALSHPAIGLFHAFKAQAPAHQGVACLIDVGGSHLHLVLVKDGDLVFMRSHAPGMDETVRQVAAKRGISEIDAAALVRKIAVGSPDDLKSLIANQAGAISAAITANVRFCRTQLKLSEFEPTQIHVAGAGALAHGFLATLADRTGLPVRLINPFAGQISRLPTDLSDRLAGLPSPWAVAIGGASAPLWELDALSDERRERTHYWRTDGALKVAAAAAVLLSVVGVVAIEGTLARSSSRLAELEATVPKAQDMAKKIAASRDRQVADANRLLWLDAERRPGRVAVELLNGIAKLQDPATCPVILTGYQVGRQPGMVVVELAGSATSAKVSAESAIRAFKNGLQQNYPAIATIEELPTAIEKDRLSFKYRLAIPDG